MVQQSGDTLSEIRAISIIKDLFFVTATALLLYFLTRKYYKDLARSEKEYRYLFEDNPQPMWIYRREDLKFLAVNKSAIQKYGYAEETFLEKDLRLIVPEEDIPAMEKAIAKSISSNSVNDQFITRHQKKSGQIFFSHISSQKTTFKGQPARHVVALDIDEKHRADQKAKALNQQLKDILENMEDGFFALDKNWRYILVNPAVGQFVGLKPEQLLGTRLQEASPMFLLPPYKGPIQAVMEKSKPAQLEEMYTQEGNWLQLRLFPFNDGICGFFSDITQRKKNEKRLKIALERYRTVSKATNEVIWERKFETGKIIWNSGVYRTMKYQPQEVEGNMKWWEERIHPEEYETVMASLREVLNERKTNWEAKYRFLCKDKEYRYFHDRAHFFYNEQQEPVRGIGAMQDIHQERLYQEEIDKLSLVARKTRNGVIITDKNGITEWVNDGFTRITGYTLNEIAGKKPGDLLQGKDTNPNTILYIKEKLKQESDFSSEIVNYNKNGTPIWIRMDISAIFENGQLVKFIGITTEITERKKFEEKLKQQNEQLKEIAWISSHDVRRPVASILGLISLYNKEKPLQDFNYEILTHLNTCAHELDHVIRKIVFKTYEIGELQEGGEPATKNEVKEDYLK